MDIGEDLIKAGSMAQPFGVSQSASELESIGFADSKDLEKEAIELDPIEKQKSDLLKKQ